MQGRRPWSLGISAVQQAAGAVAVVAVGWDVRRWLLAWLVQIGFIVLQFLGTFLDFTSISRVKDNCTSFDQMDDLTRPIPIEEALNDTLRIKYYHDHLSNILEAMK
ncbi:hypothetical protein RHMOL_Rhmol13G0295500 [Rhododendron molle]|uniref:Uncharacterized protein n=1 Tax=Rhododendron molle TaxID=49168 RepID=A0ACC0LCH0_RHOML|nr:hypothetical protein RHMOL_Rhmol13G0295500 [Rhododendron molle]